MKEALAIMAQQPGVIAPQFIAAQQQFAEIDEPGARASVFIGTVDVDLRFHAQIVAVIKLGGAQAFILARIDEPLGFFGRPLLRVQAEPPDHAFQHFLLIFRVHDLELLGQARLPPVRTQQAMGNAMKRADPHTA